jgi:CheY-like chemotaxis protein
MSTQPAGDGWSGAATPVPAGLPPVLVAEDDPQTRTVFSRLLGKLGIVNPVRFAADGQQAIDYLAEAAARGEAGPVLIVLDLNMPRRTGLDVLRWLRDGERFREVPVIMLTGSSELADVTESHDLGVASYLVKPVGFGALSDVIRRLELRWALLPSQRG